MNAAGATHRQNRFKISDDMNIDIAPDGTVYGVELLNANEQLTRDHGALSDAAIK